MRPYLIYYWSHEHPEWRQSASCPTDGWDDINETYQRLQLLRERGLNYAFIVVESGQGLPLPPSPL